MFSKNLFRSFGPKFLGLCRTYTSKKLPSGLSLEITNYKNKDNIDKDVFDETLEFINWHFIEDEPIVQAMGIEDTCDLERYIKRQLLGATVLKLTDQECDIAALAMCTVGTPDFYQSRTFAECSVCDPKTKRLLHLWADIADSNNLFKCFNVKEIWDISILATAPSYRGQGLSKLLTREARLEGKKKGFSITRMDCTSHYSAKLASSLRFVTLPPRHVLTFRDTKGAPWLPQAPPHPHGHVVVCYDFLV